MKSLVLAMILLPAIAHADYDVWGNEVPYSESHRRVDEALERLQSNYDRYAPPVLPSMVNPTRNEGSSYSGPRQWCRSDGSNTFCFDR